MKYVIAILAACFVLFYDLPGAVAKTVIKQKTTIRGYTVAPFVAVAPDISYVPPRVVMEAPVVMYHRSAVVYSTEPVQVRMDSGQTGAQRRHALKALNHARKAAKWAARS